MSQKAPLGGSDHGHHHYEHHLYNPHGNSSASNPTIITQTRMPSAEVDSVVEAVKVSRELEEQWRDRAATSEAKNVSTGQSLVAAQAAIKAANAEV